jgi:hypothetical protein
MPLKRYPHLTSYSLLSAPLFCPSQYPICSPKWTSWSFEPLSPPSSPDPDSGSVILYYGTPITPSAPPLAVPSILTFIAHYTYIVAIHSSNFSMTDASDILRRLRERPRGSAHYDSDWNRCLALGSGADGWTSSYELGGMDGSWEGEYTVSFSMSSELSFCPFDKLENK